MKSFLHGKRTLESAALRAPPGPALTPRTNPEEDPPAGHAPQIDLVKQGDKIVRIVVVCSCGERTEIECLYPPGQ